MASMADILNQGNSGGARQKKGSLHQQKFQKGSEVPMDIERRRRVERLMAGTAADAAAVADIGFILGAVFVSLFQGKTPEVCSSLSVLVFTFCVGCFVLCLAAFVLAVFVYYQYGCWLCDYKVWVGQ